MKITATRKEDILREKAAYEEREAAREARYRESQNKFYQAEESVLAPVKTEVERVLSKYDKLNFEVRVERNFRERVDVRISCNEREKFEEDSALSWNYDITMDINGEIKRETGSWSGLKATTPAQLESLRQTLAALEAINSFDWEALLKKAQGGLPKYDDYFDYEDSRREPRPDFETQLTEAELADIVGKDVVVKIKPFESAWYRGNEWVQLVRETPKQYEIRQWSAASYYKDTIKDEIRNDIDRNSVTVRVAKKNIVPVQPIETMEV